MPKTKLQGVVFTALMVFSMVFCMTSYTLALQAGGLRPGIFSLAIREMWTEFVIVFVLIFFWITNLARRLTARLFSPKDKPVFLILSMQAFTVAAIVPSITLIATFLHHGFTGLWLYQWIQTAVLCFPMAFFLQIFLVGPLVRFVFRTLFYPPIAFLFSSRGRRLLLRRTLRSRFPKKFRPQA